jgi:hypothetical protein
MVGALKQEKDNGQLYLFSPDLILLFSAKDESIEPVNQSIRKLGIRGKRDHPSRRFEFEKFCN